MIIELRLDTTHPTNETDKLNWNIVAVYWTKKESAGQEKKQQSRLTIIVFHNYSFIDQS